LALTSLESATSHKPTFTRPQKQAVKQSPKIEGLYLPCPQFPALEVINEIESDLRLPAVGHLTSEIWMAFKTLKIRTPIKRFGKLLTMM
jgi:maleate cis-trans isomerase